jgi:hypothetical protein
VHALYYAVAETFHNRSPADEEKVARIRRLIALVHDGARPDLQEWKARTREILSGQLKLDPQLWFHFLTRTERH